jgi:hypothetical protein
MVSYFSLMDNFDDSGRDLLGLTCGLTGDDQDAWEAARQSPLCLLRPQQSPTFAWPCALCVPLSRNTSDLGGQLLQPNTAHIIFCSFPADAPQFKVQNLGLVFSKNKI